MSPTDPNAATQHAGTEDTLLAISIEETLAASSFGAASGGATQPDGGAPVSHAAVPLGSERFTLGEELGRGGMGRVVTAVDRQFDRVVALKEVLPEAGVAAHQRFVVEALVTGNLEHPGIPSVYERGTRDGVPFYAMRKVDGRTLGALLAAARTPDERLRFLSVVVSVAQTLGYAHDRGVVHRDVKPDNVLVGPHGEAVVLDWGIAKVRGLRVADGDDAARNGAGSDGARGLGGASTAGASKTVQGAVIGTPSYMAPEQAAGQIDAIDARTDVFQLGALLYHVLAGRAPYEGATTMAVVSAAAVAKYPPLREVAPNAPVSLVAICERAMARDAAERFADGNAMVAALGAMMLAAVKREEHGASRWIARGITAAAAVIAILTTAFVFQVSPTFREGGLGAYAAVALPALSMALAVVEWRTRGKLLLDALVIALAGSTALFGIAATFTNFVFVLGRARQLVGDARSELLVVGFYESIAPLLFALPLASMALIVWAIVRRAVAAPRA